MQDGAVTWCEYYEICKTNTIVRSEVIGDYIWLAVDIFLTSHDLLNLKCCDYWHRVIN